MDNTQRAQVLLDEFARLGIDHEMYVTPGRKTRLYFDPWDRVTEAHRAVMRECWEDLLALLLAQQSAAAQAALQPEPESTPEQKPEPQPVEPEPVVWTRGYLRLVTMADVRDCFGGDPPKDMTLNHAYEEARTWLIRQEQAKRDAELPFLIARHRARIGGW